VNLTLFKGEFFRVKLSHTFIQQIGGMLGERSVGDCVSIV